MANLSIYSTISHQVRIITILGMLIKLRLIIAEQLFLKSFFFSYTIIEWNKLDIDILKSKSYATFRNTLLKLGRPIYSNSSPVGLKLLNRLRLGLSHLNEHRFNYNFQNCINPLCSCSLEIESTSHFLLHCHYYTNIRVTLLSSITEIIGNTFNINDECLVSLLLFGSHKYTEIDNSYIVNATIKYLLDSGRFNGPLLLFTKQFDFDYTYG